MISIARTFGAPLTVPAGNVARSTSTAVRPSASSPDDLAREVHHVRVALERHQLVDLLGAELHDPPDVVAGEVDEHHVLGPLLRVLARARRPCAGRAPRCGRGSGCRRSGRLITRPSSTCTIGSGDEPTSVASGWRRKYMYGDGFTWRSTRYTSNGSSGPSRSKRCASTTWKMSPARMCSRAASTASRYTSPAHGRVVNGGSSVELVGGRRRRHVRQRAGELVDQRRRAGRPRASYAASIASSLAPRREEHVLDQVEPLAEVVERGDVPGERQHRVGQADGRRAGRRAAARSRARRRSRGSRRRRRGTAGARRCCGAR